MNGPQYHDQPSEVGKGVQEPDTRSLASFAPQPLSCPSRDTKTEIPPFTLLTLGAPIPLPWLQGACREQFWDHPLMTLVNLKLAKHELRNSKVSLVFSNRGLCTTPHSETGPQHGMAFLGQHAENLQPIHLIPASGVPVVNKNKPRVSTAAWTIYTSHNSSVSNIHSVSVPQR